MSSSFSRAVARLCFACLVASPATLQAQFIGAPVGLQVGLPQGEFANNVAMAGGLGGAALFGIGDFIGIRAGFDIQIYGSDTRRVPLGGGALGLINVDVTTTNFIFGGGLGAQLGLPGPSIRPYLGGMIGFSSFTTTSSVQGSNSDDEPFASSNNSVDNTFAKSVYGGLYVPLGSNAMLDLGLRHTWNGESVRYLTPGDISEDPVTGDVILSPRNTRADLLTVTIGLVLRSTAPRNLR